MSAINHHKYLVLQNCAYLGQRLGFLIRHPQELVGFLARAVAIYRSQGWKGITQGLRRDRKGVDGGGPDNSIRDYQQWLAAETHSAPAAEILEAAPFFTVLLNAGRADADSLSATINSIVDQSYTGWELFVVGISPTSGTQSSLMGRLSSQRIRYVEQPPDQTTDASFSALLAMTAGTYLIPLDCGGILARQTLVNFASQLAANHDAVLCYSDHDHVDSQGARSAPYFKPDWNPLLLLTQNYIGPLAAFKMSEIKPTNDFFPRQNCHLAWNLALQAAATAKANQIIHLAKILIHIRLEATLPLPDRDCSAQAMAEIEKTLAPHLPRMGFPGARIVRTEEGAIRLCPPIPEPQPKVSIIIPTRNSQDILERCVNSIFQKTSYQNFEIIIIDNQSDDPTLHRYLESLATRPDVRLLAYDAPFNYSAINNFAAQQCQSEILCFLNNDVEVITPDWLTELVGHALHLKHGAVGAMLYYPDGRIQHGGIILGHSANGPGGVAANAFWGLPHGFSGQGERLKHAQYVSSVTGACLAVRRTIFEEVNGFDQENLAVAYNDVDLCLRLRERGYDTVFTPFAELYHHESVSRGHDNTDAQQARFSREILYMHRRWGKVLQHDPYFPSGDLGICQWQ